MTLNELRDRLRAMTPEKMGEVINRCVKKNEDKILDLNRQDQLFNRGVNYNEERITPEYSPSTKARKGYDRVTLHDTGRWYENFRIIYRLYNIEIYVMPDRRVKSVELTGYLRERYGKEIIGISEKNIHGMAGMIKDDLINRIRKELWA